MFETAWSLYGFERFQIDLANHPEMPLYVMERIAEVHLENLRRVLELAGDLIDLVYFYDDAATGDGLLISPKMYERYLQPFHQRLTDKARQFNKPTMLHCCGSVYSLIPRWIDMGLSVLNPIQPLARSMEPERLAAEFGGESPFMVASISRSRYPRRVPPRCANASSTCPNSWAGGEVTSWPDPIICKRTRRWRISWPCMAFTRSEKSMGKVTIVGSYIVALVMDLDRIPVEGETLIGRNYHTTHGGKGSNMAAAASPTTSLRRCLPRRCASRVMTTSSN